MNRSQAEILLQLAVNTSSDGNDLTDEINRLGRAHAQRLMDEAAMLAKAMEINRDGQQRFATFMPRQPQGEGRPAIDRTLAEQRALAHARKAAE